MSVSDDQLKEPQDVLTLYADMDTIFQNADATLVAAAGADADHGLPGVNACARKPTPAAHIKGFDFAIVQTTSALQNHIRASKYNTRAWCFQETLLSRRLIIFTEFEVYYESRGKGNRREIVEPPFQNLDANMFISDKPVFDPWNAYNPEVVNETIAKYSSRDLSRQEDALLAALGFLKEFRNGPNPVYHHWGVPIFPDQAIGLGHSRVTFPYMGPQRGEPFSDQGFLLGLTWRPAGDHMSGDNSILPRRRSTLPSWSWVGWSCTLDLKPQSVYDIQQWHAHPHDQVLVQLGDLGFVPLKRLCDPQTTGRMGSFEISLSVRTIPLEFRQIRRENMTPAQQEQYPEPYALVCDGIDFSFCYGGWGSRTDSFISLLPSKEVGDRVSLAPSSEPLVGIFLGRVEDKRDWPYGKQFFLVACQQESGLYYERVGHIIQGDERVGLKVRQILDKQAKRQRLLIR